MRCVVLQPSYIPWRGHFDQFRRADKVVFYDDVQYDKHGWRNRNRIKTPQGSSWLTIPVQHRGNVLHGTPICDIRIVADGWNRKHWKTLRHSYAKAPHFARYAAVLEESYRSPPELLADFTIGLTIRLAAEFEIPAEKFLRSSELGIEGHRTERLVAICRELDADRYLTGPSALDYLEPERFDRAGIALEVMSYDYPEYQQLYPPYDPAVSILDLLFMTGDEASRYLVPCRGLSEL